MPKEVHIVGAGVIGLLLGKELASSGIKTTVYDAKKAVSDNTAKASGIFSKEGLATLGVDYDDAVVNTLDGAILHAGNEKMRIRSPSLKAYVLDRGDFASLCAKEAKSAGADIVLSNRFEKKAMLELQKDDNNIIVGADGAVSTVASAFGFPEIREYILTYKSEYENARVEDEHLVELFFSNKIAHRFFGWTVPYSKTKLEVGVGVSMRAKKNSTYAFNQLVNMDYLKGILANSKKTAGYASLIPLGARAQTVKKNVLLVGDAAGQVKATTGGGIIFGAACAKTAAKSIIDAVEKGRPLATYEKEWRRRYELDLKMHDFLHKMYSGFSEKGLGRLMKVARAFGMERFLGLYGDMDRPSVVIKRFFLRGHGE